MPAENVLHADDGAPEIQMMIHSCNCQHLLVAKKDIRETQVMDNGDEDCDDALADQSARYALAREKRVT
ncbi:hypothetical protein [Sodalis sp.]|uniref:hypothetical protein n=1 Tax=Sodalis sp. (in: enterobacteria) TaxID=1898979 RepID=UPI003873B806